MVLNIPVLASMDWPALAIALAAMVAIFRFKAGIIPMLAASCMAGIVFHYAAGF